MNINTSPLQIQKQVLAPWMQQSIKVLLLPITDLRATIEQELLENPLLEAEEMTAQNDDSLRLEEIVNQSLQMIKDRRQTLSPMDPTNDDDTSDDIPIFRSISLEDHLLQQLSFEIIDPLEFKLGEYIIGDLDEDGYFKGDCAELARTFDLPDQKLIEKVFITIQNFDPVGIGSRNLKECLIAQISNKLSQSGMHTIKLINDHLENLGRRNYAVIGRNLKIPIETVKELAQKIAALEPKPARKYRPLEPNIYIKPDMTIKKNDEGALQVVLNKDNVPQLRINKIYQNILNQPNRTREASDYVREKVKNAILFIKSIEQRHQTLTEIGNYILNRQKDFFEQEHASIKPMILKDVADSIERNQSTISRAINNKYIDTPQGIYPMKYFFSQGLAGQSGDNGPISSRSVKEDIKDLIKDEDKCKPLSDQDIQLHFERQGMKVARRTVSKYRQGLKILPSHLRRH